MTYDHRHEALLSIQGSLPSLGVQSFHQGSISSEFQSELDPLFQVRTEVQETPAGREEGVLQQVPGTEAG